MKENHHNSGEEKNSNPDEPPDNNVRTKYETIEDGTEAFMKWMGSSDKKSLISGNPIVLIKFINDVSTILYDTTLSNNIEVKLTGGVPYCNYCKSDDCAHVGFTICLEQLGGHRHDGKEETTDDIVGS
ncbi:MAG: hypothetical protein QOK69_01645 [Nitrososphaeraceae archaeon]|nr:hypothetical protein [Nitrososphaeraceae archaeon]